MRCAGDPATDTFSCGPASPSAYTPLDDRRRPGQEAPPATRRVPCAERSSSTCANASVVVRAYCMA